MPAAPLPVLPTTSSLHSQPTVSAKDQPTARPTAVTTIHQPARDTQRRRRSHSPSPPTTPAAAPVTAPASASAAATSAARPAVTEPRASTSVAQDQVTAPPAIPPNAASKVHSAHTPSHCRQVRAAARVLCRAPAVASALTCSSPQLFSTIPGTTTTGGLALLWPPLLRGTWIPANAGMMGGRLPLSRAEKQRGWCQYPGTSPAMQLRSAIPAWPATRRPSGGASSG